MTPAPCTFRRAVDAHFEAGLAPEEEHSLRLHLPTCPDCTRRYEKLLLLESITPDAPGPKERLRRGLSFDRPEAAPKVVPLRRRWVAPAAAFAALAAALLLFVRPPPSQDEAGFHARGSAAPSATAIAPRLEIYRLRGTTSTVVEGAVSRDDELAFAYANPQGKKRLLVFAVDEHRHVYWYYPAWTRPEENPTAVSIVAKTDLVELREGVSHAFDGQKLRIYGVFTDDALTARDVETHIGRSEALAPVLGLPGTTPRDEVSRLLEVR